MTQHFLEPGPGTLHYDFSREREPVLWIESGDVVVASTLDASGHLEPRPLDWSSGRRAAGSGGGHALVGPIGVREAGAGRTLEIEVREVRPGPWGWSAAARDGERRMLRWRLDPELMVAEDGGGTRVRLRPFLGVIGMPPDEPGAHATGPPRACGGNLDCRELVAGSRLRLPISVDGALLSFGDGHGAQGDGEVSGTGIECPLERVVLRVRVIDTPTRLPTAETPAGYITFGLSESLNEAAAQATDAMVEHIAERRGVDRLTALSLASLLVDLRVTQIANGVFGVHALLPAPGSAESREA